MAAVNQIQILNLPAITAAASGTARTMRVSLKGLRPKGNFAVTVVFTGTGTGTLRYLLKDALADAFIIPTTNADILTGQLAGTATAPFTPDVTPYIGFELEETGTSNSITAQITVKIQ